MVPANTPPQFQAFANTFSSLLASSLNHQEIISALLHEGLRQKASDINIEPAAENVCDLFFRVDGILCKVMTASGRQATLLREAVHCNSRELHPGKFGVNEGIIQIQLGDIVHLLQVYDIPQSPANSILIKAACNPASLASSLLRPAGPNRTLRNIDKKIFIWQMGKVGSSSVYSSLLPHSQPSPWQVPSIQDNSHHWPIHNNVIQTHETKLLYDILHYSDEEFVIISLVRDLLDRNISAIFQSMNYEESWRNQYFIAREDDFKKMPYDRQEEAILHHLQRLNTGSAVTSWYDNLFKSHIYYPEIDKYFIDIYAKPFDQEKGLQIYESKSPRVTMVIVRLEDLNRREKELGAFLGIDGFRLLSRNRAEEKWYQPIYTRFKERYKPSTDELEAIYSSRFMQYFYSAEQINTLKNKWGKP